MPPSKLTPERQIAIVKHLKAGATIEATCDSVKLGKTTYYQWIAIGTAYLNGETHERMPHLKKDRQVYADFVNEVRHARAEGLVHAAQCFRAGMSPQETVSETTETYTETRLRTVTHEDGTKEQVPYEYQKTTVRVTNTVSPGDWRAARDYLARRDPKHWAASARLDHSGKIDHEHKHEGKIDLMREVFDEMKAYEDELTPDNVVPIRKDA